MATFVLLPGAGSDSWYWHLVVPDLEVAGHDVVAVDLPVTDDTAGFTEYADVVVDAIGDRRDVVLVAQSLAGFTAPLVCERVPVELMILVAAMVPRPGESGGAWWVNTGHAEARGPDASDDPVELFLHDVPADVARESEHHVFAQSGKPFESPWPLDAWPDVPTRFLLCRDDRFFPAEFQRRVVRERLGIEADEMDGGHLPALSRPHELAERLLHYLAEVDARRSSVRAVSIQAVSHVAVGVRDMETALGFYRDVLGLRVTADKIEEFSQGPGQPPAQRRAVYLRYQDGPHESFIVLDQQITNEIKGQPAQLFQMGVHHFAFWVDDIDGMMARVHDAGVTVLMGGGDGPGADTTMYGEPAGGHVRSVFLQDPEGNYVQLDQRA